MKKQPIHSSIKQRLGYADFQSDEEVYADWQARLRRVCKPCWELKYCPYGPLVEQLPILPSERSSQVAHNQYLNSCLETGTVGSVVQLDEDMRAMYEEWLEDEQILISQVLHDMMQADRFGQIDESLEPEERVQKLIGEPLPPVHEYRAEFDGFQRRDYFEEDFPPEIWARVVDGVDKRRKEIEEALATGEADQRQPMEPGRREMFEALTADFDPYDYPETIPQTFIDGECSVFGHICPVFFAAEIATETEVSRRIGRRNLKFETMMRIVRRDDYRCQHCKKQLRDDEVEFDHIIPVSKGGSSEEHNMRLTCYDCNRDKSDKFQP